MQEQGLELQRMSQLTSNLEFVHRVVAVLNSQNLNHAEPDSPCSVDRSHQDHIWPMPTSNEVDALPRACFLTTSAERPAAKS